MNFVKVRLIYSTRVLRITLALWKGKIGNKRQSYSKGRVVKLWSTRSEKLPKPEINVFHGNFQEHVWPWLLIDTHILGLYICITEIDVYGFLVLLPHRLKPKLKFSQFFDENSAFSAVKIPWTWVCCRH